MDNPPKSTNPKVLDALEQIVQRARTGFTGSLVFDFKDGVPLALKVTESRRLGAAPDGTHLTAGS